MPFRGNIQNALPLFPYKSREGSGWNRCQKVKRTTTFSTLNLKLFFTAGETVFIFIYFFFLFYLLVVESQDLSQRQCPVWSRDLCAGVPYPASPPPRGSAGSLSLLHFKQMIGRGGIQRMGGPESNLWSKSEFCVVCSGLSGGFCSALKASLFSVYPCAAL